MDRRSVLRVACGGCAALALSACGGSSTPTAGPGTVTSGPSPTADTASPASPASPAAATAIAKLADIPVGSSIKGKAGGESLLLARPTDGTVVAFSAICTHQSCTVEPAGKELVCPCHQSHYDAFTGKVLSGPAPRPLTAFPVAVQDGNVVPA
jgi:nitrite reductase/ring-hydroxylating ferredoxin subunit